VSETKKRVRVRIEGLVQGVFYRASTRRQAAVLGVYGTVRNLPDGAVEAVMEGDAGAVDRLLDWCHVGPAGADVTAVRAVDEPYRGEFTDFRVIG